METTKRKKILWIDDDSRILKGFLRKVADEGVDVEYAGFALEGYRMLERLAQIIRFDSRGYHSAAFPNV